MSDDTWSLAWVGDSALAVHVRDEAALDANARVHVLADSVRTAGIDGVRDVVPGMRDLVVHLDPLRCDVTLVERALARAVAPAQVVTSDATAFRVPVRFGGDGGPDLDEVARACGCSSSEVIRRITGVAFTVHFIGFLPGFPYLGPLDPTLRLPRRATPRHRVPPGSVAIAGEYAGIYPWESPGGWHLIGHTDITLFDPAREPPARLTPGMRVRLVEADA